MVGVRRSLGALLGATAAVLALTSCGSDSSGIPDAKATASKDGDGFTAKEREVIDAVERYTDESVAYSQGESDAAKLKAVATGGIVDSMTTSFTPDKGRVLIGDYTFKATSVKITGDSARVQGCSDFSETFMVDRGTTSPGVGDKPGVANIVDYTLERHGNAWLMADPKRSETPC